MISPLVVGQPAQTAADLAGGYLDLLAAVIATDSRATAIFSQGGELLLTNCEPGSAKVAQWQSFGRSTDWVPARDEAQASGSCKISTGNEDIAELHVIRAKSGVGPYYLMRIADEPATAEEGALSRRIVGMAHDLRAPLQSLIIAADGLAGAETKNGTAAELGALARLAIDQIGILLETARMKGGAAYAEPPVDFDLVAVVRDTIRLLDPICRSSNNFIIAELPDGEAWYSGAPQLLRAILQNLITNANRFHLNGAITVRLKIAVGQGASENLVTLEIEDEGPGLTEAEQKLVLAPGGGAAVSASKGGYGLGLGIVSRAVEGLRGQIALGQGQERGTLFRITFPLSPAGARDEQTAQDTPDRPEMISLAGLRILVVEDNPVNLPILLRALTDAGAAAEGVVNGMDALLRVRAKKDQFDVVLLDFTLPDIDGIEVARQIRSGEKAGQHLLIIGLTAHVGSAIHGSALAAGMDQILVKPVRPSELRRALRDASAGAGPRNQVMNRVETPDAMLNNALVLELSAEMGRPATLAFMQRALEEAKTVFALARRQESPDRLRAQIHSAIGSAGLTGLAGIEHALRNLQTKLRAGICDDTTLDIAEETADNTAMRLQQFLTES